MTKDVLVTGGAGFVGSHLCEALLDHGYEVYSYDNYFTGTRKNHVPGVIYYAAETKNIREAFNSRHYFDYCFHLGEYSRVEQSFEDIDLVKRYNEEGTNAVFEFAKHNVGKLIYSGSSTKYAHADNDYEISPYAASKIKNVEKLLTSDLNYAITYFYNVYGPREISTGKYATLIAKYTELMKNGKELPVVLPGTQKRNFTHVSDIVNALIDIMYHGKGDGYGIANPQAYSVLEVAEMFGGKIKYLPERKGNRKSADVVINKTLELGWSPKINLNDYINKIREQAYDIREHV